MAELRHANDRNGSCNAEQHKQASADDFFDFHKNSPSVVIFWIPCYYTT